MAMKPPEIRESQREPEDKSWPYWTDFFYRHNHTPNAENAKRAALSWEPIIEFRN